MAQIKKFKNSLTQHNIDPATVEQIMKDYENIKDWHKKEKKVEFFIQAMKRMDELMDEQTRYEVRDACACCKGGWREKTCRFVYEIVECNEGRSE